MIPKVLNIGSGKNYMPEALNVDSNPMFKPDIVWDVSTPIKDSFLPLGYFDKIIAHDVLEHIPDLVSAMTNCLNLLKDDGEMDIIVPYDLSREAWSDPTHVRAFNERSWLYFSDWSWYLGWKDYAFAVIKCELCVAEGVNPDTPIEILTKTPRMVNAMKVILRKAKVIQPDIKYGKQN